ncbi:hypothetical protein [Anaerotignum propionicum]|uniref:hypothetical protein n=1 Tax=Anaerotignum propionicum TaxID=28446 RepID=UPI0013565CD0|nr:hypothetical protein [Anaerotignum propionicum]
MSKKPSYDLRIVAKYLYHVENLKPNQIYKRLVKIMEEKYYNFAISQWQDLLLNIAKHAKKRDLINIDYIPVTKNELLTIDGIKSKPMKRIAFTMLCLAKYRNMVNENNRDWINYDFKDIFRMANVTATIKEQCFMIHDMKALGLIKMNKLVNNLSVNVCYIDKTESEEVLKIDDFRNLGYEYLLYCGEKFFRCKRCGVLKRRTASNMSYCRECAEIVENQKTKERVQKFRSSKM